MTPIIHPPSSAYPNTATVTSRIGTDKEQSSHGNVTNECTGVCSRMGCDDQRSRLRKEEWGAVVIEGIRRGGEGNCGKTIGSRSATVWGNIPGPFGPLRLSDGGIQLKLPVLITSPTVRQLALEIGLYIAALRH